MSKVEQIFPVAGDVLIFEKAISSNFINVDSVSKIDYIKSNIYKLLLRNNENFTRPDLTPGISYKIIIQQDSIGNRLLSFNEDFVFLKGSVSDINTTANSITILTLETDGTTIYCFIDSLVSNFNSTSVITVNKDYDDEVGIELGVLGGVIYNQFNQSGALDITIASGSVIGSSAILPILIDGNTITVTGATKDPKSDTASTISGDTDRYVFWKDTLGVYYSITNMGQ